MTRFAIVCALALISIYSEAAAQTCAGNPVAVQILGSGGPAFNRERASAGYLLWVGAQAKMVVGLGGGTFARFAQTQAKPGDLSLLAISHLHPDHTSDLAAFMWATRNIRPEKLPVVGPSGNDAAPS